MMTVAVSKFKATCLALLERVRKTGEPILVTKRGVPIAQVVPPPPPEPKESAFGALKGTAEEIEDIVEPLPAEEWEALR
jgi:prevent-host-death family protein